MAEAQDGTSKEHGKGSTPANPDADDRRVLRLILYDALASEAMGTLTTGVFLVGFAVTLGANNFAIGVLAAVPFFVQLLQVPAVLLVERWRVRRDICVFSTAVGRAFLVGAAAAPLIGGSLAVVALIASLAIYQGMAAIAGCAWNSWMRDLVPSAQYGRFFGRRTAVTTALSVVVALGGGVVIDLWKDYVPEYAVFGYSLLFLVSTIVGYVGVYLLRITPDKPNGSGRKGRTCACATCCAAARSKLQAPDHFSGIVEFCRQPGSTVFHSLHAEVTRLSDDYNSCAYNCEPAEQHRRVGIVGSPH
jgi:hypothetical protein